MLLIDRMVIERYKGVYPFAKRDDTGWMVEKGDVIGGGWTTDASGPEGWSPPSWPVGLLGDQIFHGDTTCLFVQTLTEHGCFNWFLHRIGGHAPSTGFSRYGTSGGRDGEGHNESHTLLHCVVLNRQDRPYFGGGNLIARMLGTLGRRWSVLRRLFWRPKS